jgi:hypothetical protein
LGPSQTYMPTAMKGRRGSKANRRMLLADSIPDASRRNVSTSGNGALKGGHPPPRIQSPSPLRHTRARQLRLLVENERRERILRAAILDSSLRNSLGSGQAQVGRIRSGVSTWTWLPSDPPDPEFCWQDSRGDKAVCR